MIDDRSPQLEGVTILFLITSIVAVSLRSYVRAIILRSFGWDDWLAVATLICFIIFCGFVLQAIEYGSGQRLRNVPAENLPKIVKCRWFGEFFYVITSVLVKYSVGIFLLRITAFRWQKILIWVVLSVVLAFNIFYLFIVIFQCSPPSYYWTRFLGTEKGTCLPKPFISTTAYVGSAINAWADWMLGLLPVSVVWKLDLRGRDKVSLAFILALGSIACSATIVRTFYVWQLTDAEDFLFGFTDIAIWSTVENGLGLTASSMATLRPLIRRLISCFSCSDGGAGPTQYPTQDRDTTLYGRVFIPQELPIGLGRVVINGRSALDIRQESNERDRCSIRVYCDQRVFENFPKEHPTNQASTVY